MRGSGGSEGTAVVSAGEPRRPWLQPATRSTLEVMIDTVTKNPSKHTDLSPNLQHCLPHGYLDRPLTSAANPQSHRRHQCERKPCRSRQEYQLGEPLDREYENYAEDGRSEDKERQRAEDRQAAEHSAGVARGRERECD